MSIWGGRSSDQLLVIIAIVAAIFVLSLAAFVFLAPQTSQPVQTGSFVSVDDKNKSDERPVTSLKVTYTK
jgi:hypothetical protein